MTVNSRRNLGKCPNRNLENYVMCFRLSNLQMLSIVMPEILINFSKCHILIMSSKCQQREKNICLLQNNINLESFLNL